MTIVLDGLGNISYNHEKGESKVCLTISFFVGFWQNN